MGSTDARGSRHMPRTGQLDMKSRRGPAADFEVGEGSVFGEAAGLDHPVAYRGRDVAAGGVDPGLPLGRVEAGLPHAGPWPSCRRRTPGKGSQHPGPLSQASR